MKIRWWRKVHSTNQVDNTVQNEVSDGGGKYITNLLKIKQKKGVKDSVGFITS